MPVAQRLATTTDGRDVVVKQAPAGEPARRLRHEAEVLRRARHPGVVEVVAERALDDGGHELMVALVSAATAADLADDPATGPAEVAGVLAALATTVADLHDLGIAHTRLTADHVLLDDRRRPVLCGLGDAVVATGDAPLPASVRAVDVAALGTLLRQLLAATDPGDGGWEPIPARRLGALAVLGRGAGGLAGRGERWQAYARRTLLNVADRATADDPDHRPDARTFAADVLAALPEARLPGAAGPTGEAPLPSRVPRSSRSRWSGVPVAPVAGALGLGLLLVGLDGVLAGADGDPGAGPAEGAPRPLVVEAPGPTTAPATAPAAAPSSTAPPPSTTVPSTTVPPTSPPATTAPPSSRCPGEPAGGPVADPDGDGCPSPVAVVEGAVEVGGVRYSVGEPGDLLAVGDWDCDGAATVALVQWSSGRVFLFDRWAGPGRDVSVGPSAVVDGPTAVEVVGRGGCDVLVVTGAGGARTEVPG